MCFVLALFQVNPHYPLVVAANREERRDRPSTPPHEWSASPGLWAGRDEIAGGTWLGVNASGLIAAITNRRDAPADPSRPSRGLLCLGALRQPSPSQASAFVDRELAANAYNPFNLLCATTREGWVKTWRGDTTALRRGIHVVTNRGDLDAHRLPVVRRALALARQLDLATTSLESLLSGLGSICADTTGPTPICRPGGTRGTVSSSLIALDSQGRLAAYWHAEGPPSERGYSPLSVHAVAGSLA